MLEQLNEMESTGLAELAAVSDADALEKWRIAYLGTKGRLKAVMPLMKDVAREDKPAVGKRLNEVKTALGGNLCRCGAYKNIYAAVKHASALKRGGGA